jgi:hypothetical protein
MNFCSCPMYTSRPPVSDWKAELRQKSGFSSRITCSQASKGKSSTSALHVMYYRVPWSRRTIRSGSLAMS